MDLDNEVAFQRILKESKEGKVLKPANIIPLYVSQNKKMKSVIEKVENLVSMAETHNQIIYKHENMMKDLLTLSMYNARNDSFSKDIESNVSTTLFSFNESLSKQLMKKVDMEDFNKRIRDRASVKDLGTLQLEVTSQKE